MFKKSSDQLHFIERTGSHSTKASRTGRIDDIPPWAAEPEEYYNSIRDRWHLLHEQLMDAQEKLTAINEKLRLTLPFKEFEHLTQHKERLAQRARILQEQQSDYRAMARAAASHSWATVFIYVARKLLPLEDFKALEQEVMGLLNREEFGGIAKGNSEFSDEKRANQQASSQRRKRRVNWRRQHGGSVLVWGDNKPKA
jgi:hypothetical protein